MESKFGLRDYASESHWRPCEIKAFKPSKPLIICLSGNGTRTELEANGFCKLAESLIGDKSTSCDLLGVAYGGEYKESSKPGNLLDSEIEQLVDYILIPLCKDEKTGNMLPIDDCCKNLSLITFFTFCHGSKEVKNILEKFNEKMNIEGLSKQEINLLTKSMLEITYGKEISDVSCPQIDIMSAADSRGLAFNYWYFGDSDYELKKDRYVMVCDMPGQYCGKDFIFPDTRSYGAITLVAGSILNENIKNDDGALQSIEHNIGYFKCDKNGHTPYLSREGGVLRNAMSISLCERVENSILNQKSQNYIPFYLKQLNSRLEEDLPKFNRMDKTVKQELSV